MKQSHSKPSRSARKLERERRERALQHGLPAAEPPPPRRVVVPDPGRDVEESAEPSQPVAASTGVPGKTVGWRERIASIPPSIKLLGAGILVLIVIGLYRRCTEEQEVYPIEPAATPLAIPQVQSESAVPSVQASVPSAQATKTVANRLVHTDLDSEKPLGLEQSKTKVKAVAKTVSDSQPRAAVVPPQSPSGRPVAMPPAKVPEATPPSVKTPTPVNALPASPDNPY